MGRPGVGLSARVSAVVGQGQGWAGGRGDLPMYSPCRPMSGTASIFAGLGL